MRTFVAMAHYDPEGIVAPHVRRQIEALNEAAERVVVVSTADLKPAQERWLADNSQLIRRENLGYDFFSYRTGLLECGDLSGYDQVVVCNDSYVGPLRSYREVMATMSERPVDFWGMTQSDRVSRHIQSFFVSFSPWVVRSQAFQRFWQRMTPLSDRRKVILEYEVGLTTSLEGAGFRGGSYFNETPGDAVLARRRMAWWAWLMAQKVPRASRLRSFSRRSKEPWNPCAALADRGLGPATLPLVKIDTLRYDPYGLDARRLLGKCMEQYPELFGDVPAYFERTSRFYPHRPSEVLPEPSVVLRPLRNMVRYS